MKLRFILNPRSGHVRRDPTLADRLRAFIAREHLDADLVFTAVPRHATALARDAVADGCTTVVAVGGDGTVNEIAQALLDTPTALGLVPLGSGNGLARDLGVPLRTADALANLVNGAPRVIDAGVANGQPFFCALGTGFDADVVQRFNQRTRRGLVAYLQTTAAHWWRYRPERYIFHVDGARHETTALLIAVTNAAQYGNNARIAPSARLDDGLLDLVVVPPPTLFSAVPLVWRLFRGTLERDPRVRRFQSAQFIIERTEPGVFHTDGEVHPVTTRLEVSVRPACLRVIAPAPA
ncbi:MAG: diacylglycerol kinase family lipid kinase [Opitutae bacterium]|nr:diacylglycerol kinase family lipid kinase [Opitutae bacterium]